MYKNLPKGHRAMDKGQAWHTGGRGLNLDTTIVYSAPILLGTLPCALFLSHNACCPVLLCEYLSWGR